jgi:hypothetical protein
VPANPDDEVEAVLALDDEPAIDVPCRRQRARDGEEARIEAERLFEPSRPKRLPGGRTGGARGREAQAPGAGGPSAVDANAG